jgi:hypothetical protein
MQAPHYSSNFAENDGIHAVDIGDLDTNFGQKKSIWPNIIRFTCFAAAEFV